LLTLTFCSKEPDLSDIKLSDLIEPTTYADVELQYDADRSEELGVPFFAQYTSNGDLFTGTQKIYYVEDDSLYMELYYEDGLNTGSKMTRKGDTYLQKHGLYKNMPHFMEMHVNGNLIYKDIHPGNTENGLGHIRMWHRNGQLSLESFYSGYTGNNKLKQGLLTEYDEEGRITIQERYEDGELVEKIK
jgi:antitoxin component YwqK of YwqJK toxin-antitoxin module